ncbi:MAG: type IX secretion system membrane protein PorP/SprF [Lutibacter sp.]|uniref:type IX secretion system membrane protein PorP/SprF n=1 Tax=Lutibacter sp. TaxID=1925666 RepID=UPI003859B840
MNKQLYFILLVFCVNLMYGQEYFYNNQNKITGTLNPSFYGFTETSQLGVIYGNESILNGDSNIENSFAFGSAFFEDYNFSLALDVNLFQINALGYSTSQANVHYIYKTNLSYNWVLNTSLSIGYGNRKLDYSSLVFEDQIDIFTGNIAGISIDPVNVNNKVNYFDLGAGAHIHNSRNLFFGLSLKHINQPNTSFNSEAKVKKDLFISFQTGYEYDLNPYNRGSLPSNSYLYLYGSFSNQGSKSRVDLYQEAIIENFSFGLNQHLNNYLGTNLTTMGASASIFLEQMEIGGNYSFELGNKNLTGVSYNYFQIFILFDFYQFRQFRRGNNSKFFNFN